MGQMDLAKELILTAKNSGAHVAKFQKRTNRELLTPEEYETPHPVAANAYGETYGEHREFLEFDLEQHRELQTYCNEIGIEYSTSVWDLTSAKEITSLQPNFIKIPSATNQHYELQEYLCKNFNGQIQISTGMTTRDEIEKLVNFYEAQGRAKDVVLYACTSGYPVAFEDICLMEINRLQRLYGGKIGSVGFSGHHLGIAADIAAMAIGACGQEQFGCDFTYIERHFTLDRTSKGTDHAASLEPDGLRRLCRDVKNVGMALSYKQNELLEVEVTQREKLKWRPSDSRGSAAA